MFFKAQTLHSFSDSTPSLVNPILCFLCTLSRLNAAKFAIEFSAVDSLTWHYLHWLLWIACYLSFFVLLNEFFFTYGKFSGLKIEPL
jgi:hypothetical protein